MTFRLVAFLVVIAACGKYEFPRLSVPQVENTVEMVEGQGDRFAAHRACVKAEPDLAPLLDCMRASGYTFLARGPEYPSRDCWQLRERGGADLPPAHCWERAGSATSPPDAH
jgi:hypothetical protein